MSDPVVEVRGNASAEETAVVLALVTRGSPVAGTTAYATWRRTRLAALRRDPRGGATISA